MLLKLIILWNLAYYVLIGSPLRLGIVKRNRDEFIIRQVGEKHLSRQLLSFIRGFLCICTCKIILYGHLSSYFLILKAFSIWD